MASAITGYSVRLQTWYRRDGRDWIAWAPAIQVMSQERTKKGALENLREAVEGWFESCIERGILDQALREVGFSEVAPGEENDSPNLVQVARKAKTGPKRVRFEVGGRKGADYIVGEIPAVIAAGQLGELPRAAA